MDLIFDYQFIDSPYVEAIWRTKSNYVGSFISQAVTNWEMVVWQYAGETRFGVRGPETVATPADFPADAEFFGIQFKMGAFMPHLPIEQLVNGQRTLPEATGAAFWLHGATWEMPTFDNADTFIKRLVRDEILVRDPVVENVLQGELPDLSVRAVQYRFLRATGLTQSTVHQIQRAREAATRLQQGVPILDVVEESGYSDQAHLTRSLKRFMGQTPTQISRTAPLPTPK